MTPIDFKVWYTDGTTKTKADGNWRQLPDVNLAMVTIYFAETYQQWVQDGWTESGVPINQRLVTKNYCAQLFGGDYYWVVMQGTDIVSWGTGAAADVPAGPPGQVKTGTAMPDETWWPLYNAAKEERVAP